MIPGSVFRCLSLATPALNPTSVLCRVHCCGTAICWLDHLTAKKKHPQAEPDEIKFAGARGACFLSVTILLSSALIRQLLHIITQHNGSFGIGVIWGAGWRSIIPGDVISHFQREISVDCHLDSGLGVQRSIIT